MASCALFRKPRSSILHMVDCRLAKPACNEHPTRERPTTPIGRLPGSPLA